MFYTFGSIGFIWVFVWLYIYKEPRGSLDEEFVEPPKVSEITINKKVGFACLIYLGLKQNYFYIMPASYTRCNNLHLTYLRK